MKDLLDYLSKGNGFLWKNRIFYYYLFLITSSSYIVSFLSLQKGFEFTGSFLLILAYLSLGLLIFLPVFINNPNSEKPTFLTITKDLFRNAKPIMLLGLLGMLFIAVLILIFYLIFDVSLGMKFMDAVFINPSNDKDVGFYPFRALFWFATMAISIPTFFVNIVYLLQKRNIWFSISQSIKFSFKNFSFVYLLGLILGLIYSIPQIFVPDQNYLLWIIVSVFESYISLVFLLAAFFFYKSKNKLTSPTENQLRKKESKLEYWVRFAGIIILAELNLFFGFVAADAHSLIGDNIFGIALLVYFALVIIIPIAVFVLKLNKISFRINLLSVKLALIILFILLIIVASSPSN